MRHEGRDEGVAADRPVCPADRLTVKPGTTTPKARSPRRAWTSGPATGTTPPRRRRTISERNLECTNLATFLRDPVHGIENDSLDAEGGIEVPDGTAGDDVVSVRTFPAARAAVHEHRGPYQGLPAVYEALREWIVAEGLEPGPETCEIYVVNPGNATDEMDYVTRICWPVR